MKRFHALALVGAIAAVTRANAAAVRFSLEEGTKVGSKAVGLVCFPKTPLRWERQYRPDSDDVADLLKKHFGPEAETLIQAEVIDLRLSLCQPYWGIVGTRIGDRRELKGRAEIEVRWTATAPAGCKGQAREQTTRVRFPEIRGGIAGVLLKALDLSAADAARMMSSGRMCGST